MSISPINSVDKEFMKDSNTSISLDNGVIYYTTEKYENVKNKLIQAGYQIL